MRNRYSSFFTLLIIALFGISCSNKKASELSSPNVVIILCDDMGYGDISCYNENSIQTSQIDKIANEGVKLTDFYVPTPYCAPSRATLLTGRFPLRHKLIRNPTPDAGINDIGLSADEITLGEVFQDAGYKTKCIGKWHLGHIEKYFPVKHGFDEYYGILYSNDMRPVQIVQNMDTIEYPVDQSLLTQKYTAQAVDFITENKDHPFFLHLCHAMPHKPLAASEKFYTPETKDDLYKDVIRELDWSVGEVVNILTQLNILENTILIFMSDNGPYYGGSTGGLKGMKATTWEGGIRVPFIIRYPKVFEANTTVSVPCWSPDIFPTILSLAEITPEKSNYLDGKDITNILKGENLQHDAVFSLHNDKVMSIRKGDYKLFIEKPRYKRHKLDWVDSRGPDGTTIIAPFEQAGGADYPGLIPEEPLNKIQLFNLKEDITESHDLAEQMPEKVQELLEDYESWYQTLDK
ncbi:MAG: sulfatase-like hydrolase/transferase [Bacteroidales bacterium]|jgi:arylsulfatase A-like enzyme|nr:sulfatase-like hydrolase/transferase [Bacteroidales bacterium]